MIKEIDQHIWAVDGPNVVFTGISMNTRMTIIRLDDGRLWIHSPIEFSESLAQQVSALGEGIAVLVAPNKFHHLFIEPWKNRYSDAVVYAHDDLIKKIPPLADSEPLTNTAPELYANTIDQVLFSGNPVLFFAKRYSFTGRVVI